MISIFIGLLIIGQGVMMFESQISSLELIASTKNTALSTKTTYCVITDCKTISCYSIFSLDPGEIASTFIAEVFKKQCSFTISFNLIFKDCIFPDRKLSNFWLTTDFYVDTITFENCQFDYIENQAFFNNSFITTRSLAIINCQLRKINQDIFQGLPRLQNLIIRDNLIDQVEQNLLIHIAETLQTVELDRSLTSSKVLLNISTGQVLRNVQLLSLQGNDIPNVSSEILQGFPNIISLYLDSSRVSTIHRNAFQSTHSLQQVFINNNLITTLPDKLFDDLLLRNPRFRLSAFGNPWKCNCSFSWFQEMIKNHLEMMISIPKCVEPAINYNKSFLDAEFCPSAPETNVNTSIDESYNSSKSNPVLITVECPDSFTYKVRNLGRKVLSTLEYKFSRKSPNFHLQQLSNNAILVNLNYSKVSTTVLWFTVTNLDKVEQVNCLRNVTSSVQITDLNENTLYTICLMEDIQSMPSPFNCLPMEIQSKQNAQIWLANSDKATVLSAYLVTLLLFCLAGCGICLIIVRKNPSLLKGSKRVIMVHHGQVEALVLPKGFYYSSLQCSNVIKPPKLKKFNKQNLPAMAYEKQAENGYLTPIEQRRSILSNSYESIRSKSINIHANKRESSDKLPPPLPPRSFHGLIPSLSLSIDSEHKTSSNESYENQVENLFL